MPPSGGFPTRGLSAAHLRLQRVYVECLPYHEVIRRYDSSTTFHDVDPPDWDCEEMYGKGMFCKDDFPALASLLAGIEGRFQLSLNDTPEVREIFSTFTIEEVSTRYSVSNSIKNKTVMELLIRNYYSNSV